jgi:transcription elongation GreA/GreB family factor
MQDSSTATYTGRLLGGRYRIQELVGAGGMAEVYAATDERLGRRVAVKILRPHYAADPVVVARFQHEAESAARLAHPNIITVFDVGQDPGATGEPGPAGEALGTQAPAVPYIVMELVEGQTLAQELEQAGGPLPVARAVALGVQIAAAVAHAHRAGIVHRDIKPQNVLVTTDGAAKVGDFGIARAAAETQVTQPGIVWGSLPYLAPEQLRGEPASPASDVYSLGVVLYQMLAGRPPYEADTVAGLAYQQLHSEPTPLRALNPLVPAELVRIIQRALARAPEERYPSARELLVDLRRFQQATAGATQPWQARVETQAQRAVPVPAPQRPKPGPPARPYPAVPPQRRAGLAGWLIALMALAGLTALLVAGTVYATLQRGLDPAVAFGLSQPTPTPQPTPVPSPTPTPQPTPTITPTPTSTPTPAPQFALGDYRRRAWAAVLPELERYGFKVQLEEQFSDEVPSGYIIDQDPPAGAVVTVGSTVKLITSKGKDLVTIPNVVNDTAPVAMEKLQQAGFQINRQEAPDDRVPAGVVMGQQPPAGQSVPRGSTVTIVVSTGKRLVRVPDVVGKREAEAQQMIREAGLRTAPPNYQGPNDVPRQVLEQVRPGEVLSQTPQGGSMVEPGTTVYIAVRRN